MGSSFLAAYQDQIEQGIANEQAPEMGDMAQYMGGNPGVDAKPMSAVWTVEEMDGRLLGRIDCHLKEPLMPEEMADLQDEIFGQCSDGLGEGFEQRPIEKDEGDLYVSYWNSGDDYFLCTEDELDEYLEPHQGMDAMFAAFFGEGLWAVFRAVLLLVVAFIAAAIVKSLVVKLLTKTKLKALLGKRDENGGERVRLVQE